MNTIEKWFYTSEVIFLLYYPKTEPKELAEESTKFIIVIIIDRSDPLDPMSGGGEIKQTTTS